MTVNNTMMAPMGWYPVGSTLRWWDGAQWTRGYYSDGKMRVNAFMVDQPALAWVFGPVFMVLGLGNVLMSGLKNALDMHSGVDVFAGLMLIAVGILWIVIGIRSTIIRGIPAPSSAPVVFDEARPLPGEVEGYGARWVTVGPKTARWWTGVRWTHYVGQRTGVRTTFTGAAEYRFMQALGLGMLGAGALLLAASLAVFTLAGGGLFDALMIAGVLLVAGIVIVIVTQTAYRRMLLIPQSAPAPVQAG